MRYFVLVIVAIAYLAYVNSDACVQCNSATDTKCATNPESFMNKECAKNTSSICYTRVLDGNTIRGCASDLDNATALKCNNEMECLICSFLEGCNRNVFPQHRLRCLQCEGNSTSECALNVYATATVCPIYQLGDKCFVRNTGKNNTNSFQRGCLSTAQSKNVCKDLSNCYTCEGTGCNYLNVTDSQIPLARDSAYHASLSVALLVSCLLAVLRY